MNQVRNRQAGFTIIELTLAMAFIALLLLGIATLTLQIGSVYNRGLTLRAVNESGQLISSDIERTLNGARPTATFFAEDSATPGGATGGRLCSNNVVYAWNYAKALKAKRDSGTPVLNTFTDSTEEIRLIRFHGSDIFCKPLAPGVVQYPAIDSTSITRLLGTGDNNLAITKFTIDRDGTGEIGQPVAFDSDQRLYQVAITVGTGEDVVIQGNSCQNSGSRLDNEYCAVNEFKFTARAGGKGE